MRYREYIFIVDTRENDTSFPYKVIRFAKLSHPNEWNPDDLTVSSSPTSSSHPKKNSNRPTKETEVREFVCASSRSLSPSSTKVTPHCTTQFRRMGDSWRATTGRFHAGKRSAIRMETGRGRGRCRVLNDYPHRGVFPRRSQYSAIHRGNLATCTVVLVRCAVKPTVIPFSPWVIAATSFPEGGHRDCNMIRICSSSATWFWWSSDCKLQRVFPKQCFL